MKVTSQGPMTGHALFAIPVGSPSYGSAGSPVSTTGMPTRKGTSEHHWGWFAAIVMAVAAVVLLAMGVWQYSTTETTTTPATTTVATTGAPAEYAGVSVPQAMRLSDAVVSNVPVEYAGVSVPQAMRLSDAGR